MARHEHPDHPDDADGKPRVPDPVCVRGAGLPVSDAHDHHHGGGHGHGRHLGRERRGLLAALVLTATVMVVEAAGGVISGSLALLSDAGHMLADVSALGLSFLALRFGARPADVRRTYGYYRLEILSALVNGVALVGIAGVIAWEAFERLSDPRSIDTQVMIGVATIGLLANLGGLYFLSKGRGSLNVRGAFLHVLSDTLSSVAVVIGGVVIWLTGFVLLDTILSFFIASVIVVGAVRLVREATDILLEAVPAHLEYGEVCRTIGSVEGVAAVHDVHIWTITSGLYALSCHVVVDKERIAQNDLLLSRIKGQLMERFHIDHTTIQIESEGYEDLGAVC